MVKKIFILEDDENTIELLTEFFNTKGYEVDGFMTFEDAIEKIKTNNINNWCSYIIDLKIAKNSEVKCKICEHFLGFEFIKKYIPLERTVVMSGYYSPEIIDELIEIGPQSVYLKPFNLKMLLISVNSICNNFK